MGADLLLAYLPAAEITDDRKRRLHEIVNHLDETHLTGEEFQHVADDPEGVRHMLHQHIELFANATKSRDVAQLQLPHLPHAMMFTGGLSWGDDPTEMFETFELLASIEPVFAQLEIWAEEDVGTERPTLDTEDSAIEVLQEFVADVRAAFGTEHDHSIDEDRLDWPDLAITYHKAVDVLNRRGPADSSGEEPV